MLRAQGFNDTQISDMRNFTASNADNLSALNLTQAHDQLAEAYVQAIEDAANASVPVLENSMFFDREANLTGPLTEGQTLDLDGLRAQVRDAIAAGNWSALRPDARDLAAAFFNGSLAAGAPPLAADYRNATVAWAAAEVAEGGHCERPNPCSGRAKFISWALSDLVKKSW